MIQEVRLYAVLDYFFGLSFAQIVMHVAFLILALVILIMFLPSGKSAKNDAASSAYVQNSTPKKKKTFERKEPGWDGAAVNSTSSAVDQSPKPSLWSRIFGGGKKEEILTSQNETVPGFTHPNVTDHFNELKKQGPASDLKAPDTDELDQIFTTMIKAGSVTGKPHLVTNFEHQYLEKLRIWFSYRCYIYCQVSVGSVVSINANVSNLPAQQRLKFAQKCQNMSFDFLLVEKSSERIICAIELDDPTHLHPDRISRDRRLDKVCAAANIPIFHITNIYQKPDLRRMIKGIN